jgi:hypothetical protein
MVHGSVDVPWNVQCRRLYVLMSVCSCKNQIIVILNITLTLNEALGVDVDRRGGVICFRKQHNGKEFPPVVTDAC